MKKSITLIVALAMILGMSQCKKKIETVTANEMDGGVFITLDLNGGEKHIVNPATGTVDYTDGDVIYVGNDGKYCGTLTRTDGQFSGTIYPTSTDDYLHFYFVGGSTPSATPEAGTTESFTVNISDQSSNLPVLSYAKSTILYTEGVTAYESFLLNKCALVNITLTEGTTNAVTINNMLTVATIDFATPGITPAATTGNITLYSVSTTSKWAILLPTAATNTNVTIGGNDYDVTVPEITANGYLHDETAIVVDNAAPAVDYVFSVSSTQTVHFSPGNLQYANEGWRFAEHQYDAIGSWNTSNWVDLFGWGTWGEYKNPLNTSQIVDNYQWSSDFKGTIINNSETGWFTLSGEQWQYILANSTYGMATVNGVHGIVILPDESSLTVNTAHNNWNNNIISASDWVSNFEAYGAVFLPAAGSRRGWSVSGVGSNGFYWSRTPSDANNAGYVGFNEGQAGVYGTNRCNGYSVRLVR